jgi:transcriptional regulator with XRE-family HTH domain
MNQLERIKQAIIHLKVKKIIKTQEEIAKKTGYNKSSVSEILNGKVQLSKNFILIFCSTFAVNVDYITKGEGEIFKTPNSIKLKPMENDYKKQFEREKIISHGLSTLSMKLEEENDELKFENMQLKEKINKLVEICEKCEICKNALQNGTIQTSSG